MHMHIVLVLCCPVSTEHSNRVIIRLNTSRTRKITFYTSTLTQRRSILQLVGAQLFLQEEVGLAGVDAQQGFSLGERALRHHVHRDLHARLGGAPARLHLCVDGW